MATVSGTPNMGAPRATVQRSTIHFQFNQEDRNWTMTSHSEPNIASPPTPQTFPKTKRYKNNNHQEQQQY
eukprot:2157524-Amphidinium_carterae.1